MTRKVERMARKNAKRKLWRRAISIPAAIVVFITTYALILPAIAMERDTYCGLEAHRHDDTCYQDILVCGYQEGEPEQGSISVRELTCPEAETLHKHDPVKCYNAEGELICGYADYLVHKHDANCYIDGKLVCPLPEVEKHTHTDECYSVKRVLSCGKEEQEGHVHTDDCYTVTETKELTCGQEESAGHTHTDACYTVAENTRLVCGQEESAGHTHTDECYTVTENTYLACGQEESAGHTHTDDCYTITENTRLVCGQEEGEDHTHTADCYVTEQIKELTCGQEESAGHTHTADCYVTEEIKELTCGQEESAGHTHTADCYVTEETKELTCGQEESVGHTHTDDCYTVTETKDLTCGKEEQEGHTHTDDCYTEEKTLVCTKPEVILHTHTDKCFNEYGTLTCKELEVREHQHTESCFTTREVAMGDPHVHTSACYEHVLTCELPEHVHSLACYKDPNATPVPTVAETPAPTVSETAAPEATEETEATAEPEATSEPAIGGPGMELPGVEIMPVPSDTTDEADTEVGSETEDTTEPEATEAPAPELVCGLEEHTHTEECYDEAGELICGQEEHTHTEDCWAVPVTTEEPAQDWGGWGMPEGPSFDGMIIPVPTETPAPTETPEPTAEPTPEPTPTPLPVAEVQLAICGKEEHIHTAECIGDGLEFLCGKVQHEHTEECFRTVQAELVCGLVNHTHSDYCYDENGAVICGLEEHTHNASCIGAELVCGLTEHTHTEECYDESGALICGLEEHTHSAGCTGVSTMQGEIMSGEGGIMPTAEESGSVLNLADYINPNGVTYQEGSASYDPLKEEWSAHFRMNFTIPKDVFEAGIREFDYVFPDDVKVPDDLLKTPNKSEYEDNQHRFNFWYDVDENGKYHMHVRFKDDAVEGLLNDVKCYVEFDAEGGKETYNGDIDVEFDEDAKVYVEHDKIDTRTDVSVRKTGNVSIKDGKITYTVYVESEHGTDGPITLTDTAQFGKLGVTWPDHVTVVEQVADGWNYTDVRPLTEGTGEGCYTVTDPVNGKFTMVLPPLTPKDNHSHRYVVTYEYDLPDDLDTTKYTVHNEVEAETNSDKGKGSTDVTVEKKVLSKTSSLYTDSDGKQYIRWHIIVNESGIDIAGSVLKDSFFQEHGIDLLQKFHMNPTDGVVAIDTDGNEHHTNTSGDFDFTEGGGWTIKSLKFSAVDGTEENHRMYDISYETPVGEEFWKEHGDSVTNDVEFAVPESSPYRDNSTVTPASPPPSEAPAPTEPPKKEMVGQDILSGSRDVKWHVSLPVPEGGFPAGAEFNDIIGYGDERTHYMTYDQFVAFIRALNECGLGSHISQIEFRCKNEFRQPGVHNEVGWGTYDFESGKSIEGTHELRPSCKFVELKFKLSSPVKPEELTLDERGCLAFDYWTHVPDPSDPNVTSQEVRNEFGYDAKFTVYYDGVDKSHDNTPGRDLVKFDPDTGTLTWKVKVTVGEAHTKVVVTDQLEGAAVEALTLTGVSYSTSAGNSATGNVNGSAVEFNRNGVSGKYNQSDGKTVITVTNTDDLQPGTVIDVVFTFKFNETDFNDLNTAKEVNIKEYENSAEVDFDGKPKSDQDKITVEGKTETDESGKYIDKRELPPFDNDSNFNFAVDLNPNGKNLNETSDFVELTDVLSYKVYKQVGIEQSFRAWFADAEEKHPGVTLDQYGSGIEVLYDQVYELDTSSVKLYKAKMEEDGKTPLTDENGRLVPGDLVPDSQWTLEVSSTTSDEETDWNIKGQKNRTCSINIKCNVPDETPLVLVYTYTARAENWRCVVGNSEPYTTYPLTQKELEYNNGGKAIQYAVDATNDATLKGKYFAHTENHGEWKRVTVGAGSYTDGYAIYKIDSKHANKHLADAEFKLYEYVDGTADIEKGTFYTDGNGAIILGAKVDNSYGGGTTYWMTVMDSDGEDNVHDVQIERDKLYYLVETNAPGGYKKPDEPPKIWFWYKGTVGSWTDLTGNGAVKPGESVYELSSNYYRSQYIPNEETETYTLPETGGVGTVVFTLAGMAVMALAGAVYCDKRRRLLAKGAVTDPGVYRPAGRPDRPAGFGKGGDRLQK